MRIKSYTLHTFILELYSSWNTQKTHTQIQLKRPSVITLVLLDLHHHDVDIGQLGAGIGREELVEAVIVLHQTGQRELQQL